MHFIILYPEALFTRSKRLASGLYYSQCENESNKAVFISVRATFQTLVFSAIVALSTLLQLTV